MLRKKILHRIPHFYSGKIFLLLGLILANLPQFSYGQIMFTEAPIEKQLYARDSNDKGHVVFEGVLSDLDPEFDTYEDLRFDVRKIDEFGVETFYKSVLVPNIVYSGNSYMIDETITIDAERSSFNFQLFGVIGSDDDLLFEVEDIVAGDVYVIEGQSNAEALRQPEETTSVTGYESPYIRVFGSNTKQSDKLTDPNDDSHRIWYYGKGSNAGTGGVANIGQWGIILAKSIVDNQNMPVAIFNGATGGRAIEYFTKTYDNSGESNEQDLNNYERLYWRLDQTNLKNKVKAILWAQGEADASINTTTSEYKDWFNGLLADWRSDYDGLLAEFYIFQTKSACGTKSSMLVKEAQRQLAEKDSIEIIQTVGLDYINNCHFSVIDGYEKFASRVYPFIAEDFYSDNSAGDTSYTTPMVIKAYLRDETTLVLETDVQNLTNNNIAISDFDLNSGNSVSITDIGVEGGKVIFDLSGFPGSNTRLSYLGRGFGVSNNTSNLIFNSSGLATGGFELVCFNEYPVDTTLMTIWDGSEWSQEKPNPGMDAEIDGAYDHSNGSFEARSLRIKEDIILNFDSGNGSAGNDSIVLYGDLIIEDDASLIIGDTESFIIRETNADADVQGNGSFIKKERSTELESQYDVTYWSSPVQGETLTNVFPNVDVNRMFHYDPRQANPIYTGAYEEYQHWFIASGTLVPGKGYSVDGNSGSSGYPMFMDVEFKGDPNFKDLPVKIYNYSGGSESYDKTNFLGNPYPAPIDPKALISENNAVFRGTLYFWTHSSPYTSGPYTDDYISYNFTGSSDSEFVEPYYIASGQGFMILTDDDNVDFWFRNSMMKGGGNDQFFKETRQKESNSLERSRLWVKLVSPDGGEKEMLIGFMEGASDGYDPGYDGELFTSDDNFAVYSKIGGTKYGIVAMDNFSSPHRRSKHRYSIPLSYTLPIDGGFSIEISRIEGKVSGGQVKVFLIDRKLKSVHDLKAGKYSFNEELPGEYDDRFKLIFVETKISETEDEFLLNDDVVLDWDLNGHQVFSDSEPRLFEIRVYDILGRRLLWLQNPKGKIDLKEHLDSKNGTLLFIDKLFDDGSIKKKKYLYNK